MPSLMVSMPTLAEFFERVSAKYHVTKETAATAIKGPRGTTQMAYLRRDLDGQTLIAPLQNIDPTLALVPSVVRRLCDELKIPQSEFDLTLDELEKFTFGTY